jgi:hypothetical protein
MKRGHSTYECSRLVREIVTLDATHASLPKSPFRPRRRRRRGRNGKKIARGRTPFVVANVSLHGMGPWHPTPSNVKFDS